MNSSDKRHNQPEVFGPGLWFAIHTMALDATTESLKQAFVVYINSLCDRFPCKTCQPHFKKFIHDNPLDRYWYTSHGKDIGFFTWTWELHNSVNRRIGKAEVSLKDALAFYQSDKGVCTDCGNKNVNTGSSSISIPKLEHSIPNVSIPHVSVPSTSFTSNIPLTNGTSTSRIPPILTQYKHGDVKPKPFRSSHHSVRL
jgi:hypothetical protein